MKSLQKVYSIALCCILFACTNHPAGNNASSSKTKVDIVSNNVHIAYTDSGTGDTTLLFVHGWIINKGYWSNQIDHFNKKYRVVAIDLPGFGQSGKNRKVWTTKAYGEDIKAVIDQLHLKNVILIGHSMSGDIVLQGAIDAGNNVIGLVGVDNFKGPGVPQTGDTVKAKKEYDEAVTAMKKDFVAFATSYFNQDLFYKTTADSIRKRILADVKRADPAIAIATITQDNFDEAAKLIEANKKLYMINSDYQPTDTSGLVRKKIPYKLLTIHATGHFPMIEKPNEFNTALENVIADLRQR
ncbi:alpha/beta hydrolase [Inquilinus sp. KBS0705]|nr:alpha/beta hydrolase [Inquilinus sp. KBS0705]